MGELEAEFRRRNFDETLPHTRVNLCLAILITIAFSAMDAMVLGPQLDRIPSMVCVLVLIPVIVDPPSRRASRRGAPASTRR